MGIVIPEDHGKRCACGMTFKQAAHDLWDVVLDAWGGRFRSALATRYIIIEVLNGQIQSRRHTVQHDAYHLTM
jgi:hypothetical protein